MLASKQVLAACNESSDSLNLPLTELLLWRLADGNDQHTDNAEGSSIMGPELRSLFDFMSSEPAHAAVELEFVHSAAELPPADASPSGGHGALVSPWLAAAATLQFAAENQIWRQK